MQIERRIFRIWCIIIGAVLTVLIVATPICLKKIAEIRELKRLDTEYYQAIEDEDEDILSEYEYLSDIVMDRSYSHKFRFKYAIELNRLIGNYPYNDGFESSTVDRCIEALEGKEEELKEQFRHQAEQNVYKRYFGDAE